MSVVRGQPETSDKQNTRNKSCDPTWKKLLMVLAVQFINNVTIMSHKILIRVLIEIENREKLDTL